MNKDKKVQDLVAMLDQLMSQGGGHVEVKVEDADAPITVETTRNTDCSLGNKACNIPTLHQGIDDEKEEY